MHRKLIFNKGSYILTLPKKWVDENKLNEKKEVVLDEEENKLIVKAEDYKRPPKQRDIFVQIGTVDNIRGIVFSLIRLGYDQFGIFFDKKKKEEFIKNINYVIDNYIFGYEVAENGDNFCRVKNVIPFSTDILTVEKRSFHIVKESFREVIDFLDGRTVSMKNITNYHQKMVQCDSILRHNYSNFPFVNNPFKWQEYRDCYIIQRELFYLAEIISKIKAAEKRKVRKILEELSLMFEEIYGANFKNELPGELELTGIKSAKLDEEIKKQLSTMQISNNMILCYLFEISRTMVLFNHTLLQLKFLESEHKE